MSSTLLILGPPASFRMTAGAGFLAVIIFAFTLTMQKFVSASEALKKMLPKILELAQDSANRARRTATIPVSALS
jgi:hypothetical protein